MGGLISGLFNKNEKDKPFKLEGVKCSNEKLLRVAFTHPSYTKEQSLPYSENYERLEFLGDAVLKLVTSSLLYKKYPEYEEGDLSKIRSILVSDATLSKVALDIGLDKYLLLGSGEEHTGGRKRESNIACSLESVFGVYYLDGKVSVVEKFVERHLLPISDDIENHFVKYNAKAVLQEYTQKISNELPVYNLVETKGPAHKPHFVIEVSYQDKVLASGEGKNKKEAQQDAAYKACVELGIIEEGTNE